MAQSLTFTLRLSAAQSKVLDKLSNKLGIDKTNVVRLAITRLAEAEGILASHNQER